MPQGTAGLCWYENMKAFSDLVGSVCMPAPVEAYTDGTTAVSSTDARKLSNPFYYYISPHLCYFSSILPLFPHFTLIHCPYSLIAFLLLFSLSSCVVIRGLFWGVPLWVNLIRWCSLNGLKYIDSNGKEKCSRALLSVYWCRSVMAC